MWCCERCKDDVDNKMIQTRVNLMQWSSLSSQGWMICRGRCRWQKFEAFLTRQGFLSTAIRVKWSRAVLQQVDAVLSGQSGEVLRTLRPCSSRLFRQHSNMHKKSPCTSTSNNARSAVIQMGSLTPTRHAGSLSAAAAPASAVYFQFSARYSSVLVVVLTLCCPSWLQYSAALFKRSPKWT